MEKELETEVGNRGIEQSLETRIGNKGWGLRLGKRGKKQKRGNRGWQNRLETGVGRDRGQQLGTGVREQGLTTGIGKINWEQG